MPRIVFVAAGLLIAAGMFWPLHLLFGDSPWEAGSTFLVAAALVVLATIVSISMLLSPGRWVRVTATFLAGIWCLLALLTEIGWLWWAGLVLGAAGLALCWSRPMDAWLQSFKPDRVPMQATILTLGLVCLPGLVGGLGLPEVTLMGWVLAGVATTGAWAYARALPVVLWVIRLGLIPAGAGAAIGLHPAAASTLLAACLGLTTVAWSGQARLAVEQSTPKKVKAVSILPEMVPTPFLKSSGYDQRGRPQQDGKDQ